MTNKHITTIIEGHELEVTAHMVKQYRASGNRFLKFLLNPRDWLARHEYLCIIGIAVCLGVVCSI